MKRIPGPRPSPALAVVALAGLLAVGCSGGAGPAGRVDAPKAREALRTVLDRWKGGDKPDALKGGSPPIVVQDFDWMGGAALLSYEVDGEGKDDDSNLRIPVKLTLKTPKGQELKRSVSYVVGTSPSITVFREFN